jgi:hypothetical protein
MGITLSGRLRHDRDASCVRFGIVKDGVEMDCSISDDGLRLLSDEYDDTVRAFDSCRMAVLYCVEGVIGDRDNILRGQIRIGGRRGDLGALDIPGRGG